MENLGQIYKYKVIIQISICCPKMNQDMYHSFYYFKKFNVEYVSTLLYWYIYNVT